jgi:hypothetical protein
LNSDSNTPKGRSRKGARRRRFTGIYRGRTHPGGTPPQMFSQMIEEIAWSVFAAVDTSMVYLAWVNRWRAAKKLRPRRRRTEIQAICGATWDAFSTAVNDPKKAAAVIGRLQQRCTEQQIHLLLTVAIGPEVSGILNRVLPPALRVRRPRLRWWGHWNSPVWGGPWGRPWRRPLPLARALAGIGLPPAPPGQDLASIIAGVE